MKGVFIISLILCLVAVQIQALPVCMHLIYINSTISVYDLCNFVYPFYLQYNTEPHLNNTIAFSLAKPTTPACNRSAVTWGTLTDNNANACVNIQKDTPIFGQDSATKGIVLQYPQLENGSGNIEVTLKCDPKGPKNYDVAFSVDSWDNSTIKISGSSFYEYNIEPYLNATVSFSMARATTPLCNRTGVTWGTVTNHDANVCGNFKNENPVFAAVSQWSAVPGIVITYPELDIDAGNIEVTLLCNQTAPHDNNVNFFVESWENSTIKITGYSYWGCPLKNKHFLEY